MTPLRFAIVLGALALAGCAARPPTTLQPLVPPEVTDWRIAGRIAVSTPADGFTGRFSWNQTANGMRLDLRGPLGVGGMTIEGNADQIVLRRGREVATLTDPETDLAKMVGWELPVTSLDAWLLGRLDEDFPGSLQSARDGRVAALRQRGWQAEYTSWQNQAGYAVPKKMSVKAQDLAVRLVIDRWVPGIH